MLEWLNDPSGNNLVGHVVSKDFLNALERGYHKDDLMGYGFIGLVRALKGYNGTDSFVNFACKKIRQEIISHLRQQCQRVYSQYPSDERPYGDDFVRQADMRMDIEYYLSKVTEEQKTALMELYYYDRPWKEVRAALGWTKNRLFEERNKALRTIINDQ